MKILLIEDSKSHMALIYKLVVKVKNVEPILADDALDAYAILRATPDIKAIVVDQNLPYLKGTDFIAKVKSTKQFCDLPIIVSSAEQDVEKFLKAGASEVLLKPYDINRLMDILENLKLIEDEIAP